jgi:uncharacterized small protein (DUF1192 family)
MTISHPILDRKVELKIAEIKEQIAIHRTKVFRLEAAENTWGELADRVSAMIEAENKEIARLEAKL